VTAANEAECAGPARERRLVARDFQSPSEGMTTPGIDIHCLSIAPPETFFGELAWRVSNRATHLIAMAGGRSFPLLLVAEHPRSGGTWVAHMLADYFQMPFPKYSRLPLACPAVIHTHLWHSPRLPKSVFVARDGRDLVTSSYFSTLRQYQNLLSREKALHRHIRHFPSLRGATVEISECRRRLPQFIQEWWSRPIGCAQNWSDYTLSWCASRNVILTTYESLRADCLSEMSGLIERLTNEPADSSRLAATVARYAFEAQTGRRPGQQDHASNKRIAEVGNWRRYFSREAAAQFQSLAGDALLRMRYESDGNWVEQYPYVDL
jgi:Sulfotransferase domain